MILNLNSQELKDKVQEAVDFIQTKVNSVPEIAVVLGSGLGYFGDKIESEVELDTEVIPHYPKPTITGHQGKLIFGKVGDAPVIAVKGRSHFYEGKNFDEVTFYVLLFKELGVKKLVLTNAAGGVNPNFMPGDFVLIEGFINFGQIKVLENGAEENLLSEKLQKQTWATATEMNLKLQKGIYCWTTGPSFETPAEVQAIQKIGGSLAGMSTLPEAIVAKTLGFEVLGISLVTNQAAGISENPLTHEEVKETADKIKEPYYHFMKAVINKIFLAQ